MVAPSKLVKITPESTADDLLDDADQEPVVVERNGVRYQLSREKDDSDIPTDFDPERSFEVIEEVAGTWSSYDTEKIIADLYEAREQGTRPIHRP